MSEQSFLIDEKFLEAFGTGSLVGQLDMKDGKFPEIIELQFPKSSLEFREKNNGPGQIIVNEYTIRCLLEDVLYLKEKGITIVLKWVQLDLSH